MNRLDLFGYSKAPKSNTVIIENGEYIFIPNFFNKPESDNFFKLLKEKILWKQESMNIYGKKVQFPRLTAWYGNDDKSYSFSGITLAPNPWSEEILKIKNRIEPKANVTFNSVLLNRYRDGRDSISWHTDAEPELGKNPIIASVNFGATRKFQLRHIRTKEKIEIDLTHVGKTKVMDAVSIWWSKR